MTQRIYIVGLAAGILALGSSIAFVHFSHKNTERIAAVRLLNDASPRALITEQSEDPPSDLPAAIANATDPANTQASAIPADTPAPEPEPAGKVAGDSVRVSAKPPPVSSATTAPKPQPTPPSAPKPSSLACSGSFNAQFLCLLNQYRVSKGLGKLAYNSALNKVAVTYSAWMSTTGTFSHTGENGSRFFNRCQVAGTSCRAENLAMGAGTAQKLLDMWKNSPGHNANLLGSFATLGLGISENYATALFN